MDKSRQQQRQNGKQKSDEQELLLLSQKLDKQLSRKLNEQPSKAKQVGGLMSWMLVKTLVMVIRLQQLKLQDEQIKYLVVRTIDAHVAVFCKRCGKYFSK